MALVSSASRRERKMGQVRVLGLSRAISAALRLKRRSGSRRSLTWRAKKTNSAPVQPGGRDRQGQQAEFVAAVNAGEDGVPVLKVVQADQRGLSMMSWK
jgi:hypothetical protein